MLDTVESPFGELEAGRLIAQVPNFAEEVYRPNDMALLPYEHDVLRRLLDARPNYLFVKMPRGYWTGDEMSVLARHGFSLNEGVDPFGNLFYQVQVALLYFFIKEKNNKREHVFSYFSGL